MCSAQKVKIGISNTLKPNFYYDWCRNSKIVTLNSYIYSSFKNLYGRPF